MKQGFVKLSKFERKTQSIAFSFSYNDQIFLTEYEYDESIDFFSLEKQYGENYMNNIYLHIIAFEGNKICSLKPDTLDFGIFQKYVTPEFLKLWYTIFDNVWLQWKQENNLPDYNGPIIMQIDHLINLPITQTNSVNKALLFSSGGKDSLVCLNLMCDTGIQYDTLTYASSIYGELKPQFERAEMLIQCHNPEQQRKWIIKDSFFNSNILEQEEIGVKTLLGGETPSSVFGSLPFVLANQYQYILVGHEKSADTGQFYWEEVKREINHQYGKSYEAELLIRTYIKSYLISNCNYCSLLKPIHDVLIFALLNTCVKQVIHTNSCNMGVNSCLKCAKCLYVYLGQMAFLDKELMNQKFQTNIFDDEDCQSLFQELMGINNRLPFECIGQVQEIHFYFQLCILKGIKGKAIEYFQQNINVDLNQLLDHYTTVFSDDYVLEPLFNKIIPKFNDISQWVRNYVTQLQTEQNGYK